MSAPSPGVFHIFWERLEVPRFLEAYAKKPSVPLLDDGTTLFHHRSARQPRDEPGLFADRDFPR